MVRIYKHYDFRLQNPAHKLQRMSFSGYPGELSSDDDFYLMDTGLALLQTTNDVLNTSLYELLTPTSLLSWQRVRCSGPGSACSECVMPQTPCGLCLSPICCAILVVCKAVLEKDCSACQLARQAKARGMPALCALL